MDISTIAKDFFGAYGFSWKDSQSVLSANPKLLFNISGGVPYEEVIEGIEKPIHSRIASVQTCMRTDGWKSIGKSRRHHLCFDMLGHFSFYELDERSGKELMIRSAWDFLVTEIKIPRETLYSTVHPLDLVSQEVWKQINVPLVLSDSNTTVTPSGRLSGFRTEIVWKSSSGLNTMEIWNIVFTQFDSPDIESAPMSMIAIDSGASIDRIMTAKHGLESNYLNQLWNPVIKSMMSLGTWRCDTDVFRLADLARALIVLVSEGLQPGNKSAEYVLRKIIREAYVLCICSDATFCEYLSIACKYWSPCCDIKCVMREIALYEKTLKKGYRSYRRIIEQNGKVTENDIHFLGSTLGYPRILVEREEMLRRETER